MFCQIFFGVVIFGLFHGLLLLPVLLSWFGPAPYTSAYQKHENEKSTNDNTMVQNNYVMPDTRDSSKNEIEKDGNNTSRNEGDQDRSDSVIKEGGHDNPAMDHGEVSSELVIIYVSWRLKLRDNKSCIMKCWIRPLNL